MPRQRILRRVERLERLERGTLGDKVAQALRAYHLRGELPPPGYLRDMVARISAFSLAALRQGLFPTCPEELVD